MRAVVAEQCTGRSPHGVVAAAAPLAAALGAQCLRDGGNVFDAVTVAALAETVLLPPKCGLGGDLVALVVRDGQSRPEALIAVGGAPRRLAALAAAGRMTVDGPTSVGVPAAAAGYAALSELGVFDRSRHAEGAIRAATTGFAWSKVCTLLTTLSTSLLTAQNPAGTVYLPGGSPIASGAVTRLPGLAKVLDEWVVRGAGLMTGPVGRAVVDAVQSRAGVLEMDDLADYGGAVWKACDESRVGGHRVWTTPAPTHGPVLLDALGGLGDLGSLTAARTYRSVVGAVERFRIRNGESVADGGTSIVSGVDRHGNMAVVIHSNSFPRFGSGLVVDGLDLILANRAGRGFSSRVGSRNFPEAGRRPSTTLHAWAVAREGSPAVAVGGTPGGINQVPWNTQLMADLIRSETWPSDAVVTPRWELMPSHAGIRVEEDFSPHDVVALAVEEPRLEWAGPLGLRSAQQVVVRGDACGSMIASADPRTVGAVVPA
ncbi:gamma-glutamyltransferase [Acidiferrimicrobium sp. IK]|uniref:gamma-glutamyltransferase n=1 Tax=Acidiferrimicrobium sp. IK TaxID=2871700 RepID=UPI0021CB33FF|nr:gamma-glutamyltransferase [Acidiferrimicrobium sp. IK]MCU4187238.1 gamma-glutamyltransferase [Acidiferrimicrobium sp. IK]